MNANELADKLNSSNTNGNLCDEAATMLRQQQAEIEALKAAKIRAYNNGVEDGRKPDTNNKPVAWMSKKGILSYVNDMGFTIPLYTHPVKELGYNDIMGTWWKIMPNAKSCEGVFEFARAILRKAQEE